MKEIILVIGQSASGKSTFVLKEFLKNNAILIDKPFKHTIVNTTCLLGDYLADKRCVGTDTLSMAILPQLIDFIKNNINNYERLICEGDRITNPKFFNFIASLKTSVILYFFTCSLKESMERRLNTGSNPSEVFVKTTKTKGLNMKDLGKRLGFKIIEIQTGEENGQLSF